MTTSAFHGDSVASFVSYTLRLERGIQLLADRGIRVPPGCRVTRYPKAIAALDHARNLNDVTFNYGQALDAIVEARSLIAVLEIFGPSLSPSDAALLLSDPASTLDEGERSPGRDLQWELYVAAVCALGGLAIERAEPDVVVRDKGGTLALAVKRVKTLRKVQVRYDEAGRQIARGEHPGVAVLDLSRVVNPNHKFLRVESPIRAVEIVEGCLTQVLKNHLRLQAGASHSMTHALLAFASVPMAVIGRGGQLGTAAAAVGTALGPSDHPVAATARAFIEAFSSGMNVLDGRVT